VWVVASLALLWVILKILPYAERARVYRGVAAGFELFLHPVTLVALAALGAGLLAAGRLGRGTDAVRSAGRTQDVYLRAEPPGRISVVFSSGRRGLERDFVFERRPDEEARLLEGFDAVARRVAAFAPADGPGSRASRAEIDEARRETRALGLRLGELFLGPSPEAAERLIELPAENLLLRLAPELAPVPWEQLVPREGGQFLWQLFHVSRQLRDAVGPPTSAIPPAGPIRLLLLANLEAGADGRGLPGAEREAGEILELAARVPDRLLVVRRTPRSADEIRELLNQGFDAVHFAGHAEGSDEAGPSWALSGGARAPLRELFEAAPPLLVFANACGRAGAAGRADEGPGGAARVLLRQGVGAYLGTLWELHDAGSAAFASSFYRALTAGATLGAAVTAARNSVFDAHPFTWANYVLYGDPALRAVDRPMCAKKVRPTNDR
jgi:hypothetical protein